MSDVSTASNPVQTDQTSNGLLPDVKASVVPAEYQRVTLQVWLSVRDRDVETSSPSPTSASTLSVMPQSGPK